MILRFTPTLRCYALLRHTLCYDHTLPGTAIGYARTDIASSMVLHICYAMSGTDVRRSSVSRAAISYGHSLQGTP
eukprot:2169745-Rhodomonas_salina.1